MTWSHSTALEIFIVISVSLLNWILRCFIVAFLIKVQGSNQVQIDIETRNKVHFQKETFLCYLIYNCKNALKSFLFLFSFQIKKMKICFFFLLSKGLVRFIFRIEVLCSFLVAGEKTNLEGCVKFCVLFSKTKEKSFCSKKSRKRESSKFVLMQEMPKWF